MAAPDRIEGSWGIEPVPERLRVLGTLDTGLLCGNLGFSLLVIVAGAALVPALSLSDALVAILVGCLVGNVMLGVAGAIGTDARVPGMVLMRAPLGPARLLSPHRRQSASGHRVVGVRATHHRHGRRGSLRRAFGFRAQWLWTIVFVAGFALYQWIFPAGPSWWTDLLVNLDPPDWGIGATVPSFLIPFVLASVVAVLSRRSAERPAPA